jgi:hypothetical protein
MKWAWCLWFIAVAVAALAQPAPTVDVKGSLELIDSTPESTPVDALSVAIHSPVTYDVYRAQPNTNGQFEMKDVRPSHYRLEIGVPSRLKTLMIDGREVSPADFEITPNMQGQLRIVLSLKVGTLTLNVEGGPATPLTAVLAPNDEFLTLQSQFSHPVSARVTQFGFLPPGKYLVFIVDTDLSRNVGINAQLRDALKGEASAMDVVADENTRATAHYIAR